jgi:hypothetical protein
MKYIIEKQDNSSLDKLWIGLVPWFVSAHYDTLALFLTEP